MAAVAVLSACALPPSTAPAFTPVPFTPPALLTAQDALALVPTLVNMDDVPDAGATYVRSDFGDGWADLNGDRCSTRDDVLAHQLAGVVVGHDGCTVIAGTLIDPYTGRPESIDDGLEVDHVVSLGEGWYRGAAQWSYSDRVAFANDETNLLVTDIQTNDDKDAHGVLTWTAPTGAGECAYLARVVTVKAKWHLGVYDDERAFLTSTLTACVGVGSS